MYDRSYWKDHVTDQQGQIIQQGTLLDQAHFNNLEIGASDNSLALQIMAFKNDGSATTVKVAVRISGGMTDPKISA